MGFSVLKYELMWPVQEKEIKLGAYGFLAWGRSWGYHFNDDGVWVQGQIERDGASKGQHAGVDIMAPKGTSILCPADADIVVAGFQKTYGQRLVLSLIRPVLHGGKKIFPILTIAHCSQLLIRGGRVPAGATLALSGDSGNTGNPPCAHIHLQLEEPGEWPRKPMEIIFKGPAA